MMIYLLGEDDDYHLSDEKLSKVADKISRHFLLFDFLHERPLIIDIDLVISMAPRTGYKRQKKKSIKQGYFNFCERNRFSLVEKILRHFSILMIYLRKKPLKIILLSIFQMYFICLIIF